MSLVESMPCNLIPHSLIKILTIIVVCFSITVAGAYEAQTSREKRVEGVGDIIQLSIPSAAYITTFLLNDVNGRHQIYKSFSTNLTITYFLKYTVNDQRPENNGRHSFPSGHTSTAFQGATFIHRRYGWKYAIPAYLGASFVGIVEMKVISIILMIL